MDVLEHVELWEKLISEASRVFKFGGKFFFYTFNRNWISRLIVIHGVEWVVRNVPPQLHVYENFIRPEELAARAKKCALKVEQMLGMAPCVFSVPFLKMLLTGRVSSQFKFRFTRSLKMGYLGVASKE
jgi:2-polyprenyl-6-hydroxyphenyl methylase/3-demethylubiquinone-9 3-methyltransferase